MKNTIIKNIKIVLLAVIISTITGIFASAAVSNLVYTDKKLADGTPVDQSIKSGDFTLENKFGAFQNSALNKTTTFKGSILGNVTTKVLSLKSSTSTKLNVGVNGNMTINSGSLHIKGIQPYTTKPGLPVQLCSDSLGQTIKCTSNSSPAITSFTAVLSTPNDTFSWTSVNTKYCMANLFNTQGFTSGTASVLSERLPRGTTLTLTCAGVDEVVTRSTTL